MRALILQKTIELLNSNGYIVSPFLHTNTCFDLIAKKANTTLIVKAFDNIDALHESQAIELKKIATIFNSTVLLIGNKTKAFSLRENIVYSRYGISAINLKTLKNFFEGKIQSVNYFKGKEIVELDSKKLKEERSRQNLSYASVAKELGTTIESIYRYETGAKTTLDTAKKLEEFFKCNLVKKIDLLEPKLLSEKELFDEELETESLEKIQKLGAKIAVFKHAPFEALSNQKTSQSGKNFFEKILIDEGSTRNDIKRKAQNLDKTKKIIPTHSVIIAKKISTMSTKPILQTAIIEEQELNSMSKFKDFIELIKEREKKK